MTTVGFLIGLVAIQWVSLPRWRVVGSLIAITCLAIGGDLSAVSSLNIKEPGMPAWGLALSGGLLMGLAIGYFVQWIRSAWVGFDGAAASHRGDSGDDRE